MRKYLVALIICILAFTCQSARAQDEQAAAEGQTIAQPGPQQPDGPLMPKIMGDFRTLKATTMRARITDITDGVTVEIDNKTKVRLAGIWVPWESDAEPGEPVRKAMALLKKVSMGRYVRLYQTKNEKTGRVNRMGQTLAQVERDDGLWLQGVLLYAGLASVMTSQSNPEMAQRMYAIEADARKRKVGLWADPRWNVIKPQQAVDFANEYRVVEGKVFSTAMRNNVFYINFSKDWRTDFTVAIPSEKRMDFAKQGINLMGLNSKTIRVRGWVRTKNGPMIEISHPQQIEVLD
jgi:endonuclease YncB( thermonuclease family)